jgi:hypothetical protein
VGLVPGIDVIVIAFFRWINGNNILWVLNHDFFYFFAILTSCFEYNTQMIIPEIALGENVQF